MFLQLKELHKRFIDIYNGETHSNTLRCLYEELDEECLLALTVDDVWPSSITEPVLT